MNYPNPKTWSGEVLSNVLNLKHYAGNCVQFAWVVLNMSDYVTGLYHTFENTWMKCFEHMLHTRLMILSDYVKLVKKSLPSISSLIN